MNMECKTLSIQAEQMEMERDSSAVCRIDRHFPFCNPIISWWYVRPHKQKHTSSLALNTFYSQMLIIIVCYCIARARVRRKIRTNDNKVLPSE